MSGPPVVITTSLGRPVTNVSNLNGAVPMVVVDALGEPVTLVDAGGEPITLLNADGTLWSGSVSALAQILALEPTALWWPTEGSGWQGRTGGDLSAVGSPVGILPDVSQLGGATLDEWLANPTTPELVTNGGFDTDLTGWTNLNWTWSAGSAATTGVFGTLTQVVGERTNLKLIGIEYVKTSGRLQCQLIDSTGVNATISLGGASDLSSLGASPLSLIMSSGYDTIRFTTTDATASWTIDNISVRELPGIHAIAPTDAARPLLAADPSRLTWDKVDDRLITTMPATTGRMVLSTPEGTAVYGVNISAGSYDVGGRGGLYFPGTSLVGQTVGTFTDEEAASIATIFRAAGGGDDYGAVTNFTNFWRNWSELTTFPMLDVSSGTSFSNAWFGCTSLTTFPLLDVSSGTNFSNAWFNCNSLTTFPVLDVSSGTNFFAAWYNCNSLTSFPLLDVSSGTNFQQAWQNCTGLTTFPLLDVSSGTSFAYAWRDCRSLTTFPMLDVSSGTSFSNAWFNCTNLTTFPMLDVSSGTNFFAAWYNCNSLTSFPLLDVSSGTNFQQAWQNCTGLTTFPANMFDSVTATNFTNAFLSTNLTQTSIDNILVSINTAGTSNGTFTQSGGSAPSATGEAAIDALRGRGWTVTVTGGY